jgi:hypothetical protein
MNRKMGFEGSYLLGLDPSKMPAWGVARLVDDADAAVEAAVTVFERADVTEDMAVRRVVLLWVGRLHKKLSSAR